MLYLGWAVRSFDISFNRKVTSRSFEIETKNFKLICIKTSFKYQCLENHFKT